ncbi:hypothetical protein GCK32_017045, partial [Trichostrongylus colubriformis]
FGDLFIVARSNQSPEHVSRIPFLFECAMGLFPMSSFNQKRARICSSCWDLTSIPYMLPSRVLFDGYRIQSSQRMI